MSAVYTVQVLPIGPLGAEVKGIDLAHVSEAVIQAIKRAWYAHDVLLFRNQQLTDDHLLPFEHSAHLAEAHRGGAQSPTVSEVTRLQLPTRPATNWRARRRRSSCLRMSIAARRMRRCCN